MRALSPADLGLSDVFVHMADAVIVANVESERIVFWNAAAESLFGYSEQEALSLPLAELVPGELRERQRAGFESYRTTGHGLMLDTLAPGELRARAKNGAELQIEVTLTPIEDAPTGGRYALAIARDVSERVRTRTRDAAALRVARKMSADANPERLLDDLLEEAVAAVGGDAATVYGWRNDPEGLTVVRNTVRLLGTYLPSGRGAVGRAVERRAPVIVNDYQREPGMVESTLRAGVRAAIAAPLLYEGRLLGALGIVTYRADRQFLAGDAEVLELLAGVASSVMVGQERARLEGALLAAHTSAHELGNTLAGLIGLAQLLRRDSRLHPDLAARAGVIAQKAHEAAAKVMRLQNLKELRETRWGTVGSTIDLSERNKPDG